MDKEIARRMGWSVRTAKTVMKNAMAKLGIDRRTCLPRIMSMPMEDAPDVQLSDRDLHIARLLAEGKYMDEIARELGANIFTVKQAAQRAYAKVGVKNATGLAAWYLAKFPPAADIKPVPIGFRFYADHCDRRGEYVSSPIWAMNRDDATGSDIRVSTVWPDVTITDSPDAVRFSDGSYRLLTAAEIGAWPEFKQ
jgi:DNA-binding CsgD family transcriptional regulator